jgi:cation diffusion facilitator CzcD-associated flavoprotein CzcO
VNPDGRELTEYLVGVCAKYGIVDKIQLNTEIRQVRWLEDEAEWEIILAHLSPGAGDWSTRDRQAKVAAEGEQSTYLRTEVARAKIVVSAAGGLLEPNGWPSDIPGLDTFEGEIVHTARWGSDLNLSGKDVIVVGTGCSAAQLVPQLVRPPCNAKSVTQLMRSPPWVHPPVFTPFEVKLSERYAPGLMQHIPGLAGLVRFGLFCYTEHHWFQLLADNAYSRRQRPRVQERLLRYMRETVPEKYHEMLTPDYRLGCKRRIFDAEWFRSLQEPNIDLTTLPLTRIHPKSVTLGPGRHYPPMSKTDSQVPTNEVQLPADMIILANGYESGSWTHRFHILGKGGRRMHEVWAERGGPQAYLGIAMDQFPNFFMIYGPNTSTGHSSIILTTENAVNYCLRFIKPILRGDVSMYEVREDAERSWANLVQTGVRRTVLHDVGCSSWYKTQGSDWNSMAYP